MLDPGLWLVVAALVAVNGVMVAAEFAIVAAPRPAVDHRARQGQWTARLVRWIQRRPAEQDRFFATSQVGITLASLALGMYGEHVLAARFAASIEALGAPAWLVAHGAASVAAVALLTYVHVVFGEVVPKSVALQHAEAVARLTAPLVVALRTLLFPLVAALGLAAGGLLRLAGMARRLSAERFYTPEELELVVRESAARGALRADAGRVIRELFTFSDLTAGQVMVPRVSVQGLPLGASADEIRARLRQGPHTRYPVYEADLDHIVGAVHVKDLVRRLATGEPLAAADARPVPVVPETARLDTVLAVLRRDGAQLAVVIDEHGGTAGLLTLGDLVDEVVGEIHDRGTARPPIWSDETGRLHVAGTVRLDELGEHLDHELGREDVASVSGLILAELGRPPRLGDRVQYAGFEFEVTALAGRGVRECTVRRLD
jgi:CBS domain containing-hemolysin-like protein